MARDSAREVLECRSVFREQARDRSRIGRAERFPCALCQIELFGGRQRALLVELFQLFGRERRYVSVNDEYRHPSPASGTACKKIEYLNHLQLAVELVLAPDG